MSSRSRAQGQRTEAVPAEGPAASSALRRGIPRNSGRARGVPKPPRENSRNTQSREMTPRTPSCPREGDVGASGKKKPCRPKPRWRKPRSPPAARTKRPRLPELRLGTGSAPRRRQEAGLAHWGTTRPAGAPPLFASTRAGRAVAGVAATVPARVTEFISIRVRELGALWGGRPESRESRKAKEGSADNGMLRFPRNSPEFHERRAKGVHKCSLTKANKTSGVPKCEASVKLTQLCLCSASPGLIFRSDLQ